MDLGEIGWSGFNWLRIGTGSCEHGDEPWDSGATELELVKATK
jgi:hypothetical protein